MEGKASPATLAVTALDDYTLEVHLEAPVAYFEFMLTTSFMMPAHEATIARAGRGWTQPGRHGQQRCLFFSEPAPSTDP